MGSTSRQTRSAERWHQAGRMTLWWQQRPLLQFFAISGAFLLAVAGLCLIGVLIYFDQQASTYDLRQVGRMPQESTVFDARGEVLGYLHGDGRTVVPLTEISDHFKNALVAREDARFYEHSGVDYLGVIRAALRNARDGAVVQGASTLTMQLARNSFELRERSVRRKLVEIALARRIEKTFTKDEILFLYVNRIFFGSGLNGIEQASLGYFGKSASDLTLGEAAMIAGIIRAPNRFSPFRHYQAALSERDDTLNRMVDEGVISSEEAEIEKGIRPIVLAQEEATLNADRRKGRVQTETYLLDAVRQSLSSLLDPEQLEDGGLEIHLTIDHLLQSAAERSVEQRLKTLESTPGYDHPTFAAYESSGRTGEPNYLQAAVSLIDNPTGAIRARVGGRDFQHSEFNRATQSHRQLGSVFKPLVYAVAFETGLFPGTLISDNPIQSGEIRWDRSDWSPQNADEQYLGPKPAEFGLIKSRNTMAVRVGETAGIEAVLTMSEHAGLGKLSREQISPQIYIGNLGATLQSLTSAYSSFPSEGIRAEPYFIERVSSRSGAILYQHESKGYRVTSPAAAWLTASIMEQALQPGGTGSSVREQGFLAPAGGKTGTTNDYRDAWFAGFTSQLTCGVWVGLDTPTTIIDRGYGGRLALPIWTDVMLAAQAAGYQFEELPMAEDVMSVELCRLSGELAGDECRHQGHAYSEKAPHALIPRRICSTHQGAGLTRSEGGGFFQRVGRALGLD